MAAVIGIPLELRPLCGGAAELSAVGRTLEDVLQALAQSHPALAGRLVGADGGLAPDMDVLEDGRDLRLRGGPRAALSADCRVSLRVRRAAGASVPADERYARQELLPEIGPEGQQRLCEARVAVVGAGGLGAPALTYLAAAGVGRLTIIDGDRVDRTNLHRQPIYRDADVGSWKAEAARRFLVELNPQIEVVAVREYLTAENALDLLRGQDLVISGADNFPTRYLVSDACVLAGVPLIDAAILRFEGRLSVFLPRQGCYRCLFPVPAPAGTVPSCAEAGVVGPLAGQFGALQALEAIKLITGAGQSLAGRLLIYDALAAQTSSFRIARDPGCPVCGDHPTQTGLIDYAAFCGAPPKEAREISPQEALGLLGRADTVFVDVRPERAGPTPAIRGALRLPFEALTEGARPRLPAGRLVVFCDIGQKSRLAAALLAAEGMPAESLRGGLAAWRSAARARGE